MKLIKSLIYFIFAVFLFTGVISCSEDGPDPVKDPDPVRRTVVVYMVSANNLGTANNFDNEDLREMKKGSVNLPADARWLVYLANYYSDPKLLEVRDGVISDTLKIYENSRNGVSVTLDRMNEVLDDVAKFSPAEKYGLILWGHGSGWRGNGVDEDIPDDPYRLSPLSYGNDRGAWMNIPAIRAAVKGRGYDYIYFDVCNMACVEVAYELRDAVRYIVGGPTETPGQGMPYDRNMVFLSDGSKDALIETAKTTFNTYNGYSDDCAMTVIDLAGMDRLAKATSEIYKLTPLPHPGENVTNYYGTSRSGDFCDFGEYVNVLAESESLDTDLVREFNASLEDVVLYKDAPERFYSDAISWSQGRPVYLPIYNASGLATYIFDSPESFNKDKYDTLHWAKDVVIHHIEN